MAESPIGSQTLGEVPPLSCASLERVLQHIPPTACLAWGLLRMGCRELGRGQPKVPGFPRVDGREACAGPSILWAEGNVAMSLLPVLP